jgi:rhodanese-related sulfurtransferase
MVVTVDVLTAARELQLKQKQHEEEEEEEQVVWQYLDVRTEQEMVEGHLHNSFNVPYMFLTPQGKQCIKRTSFF